MSAKSIPCVRITCDRCDVEPSLYDDMGIAHFPTIEDARRDLVTDHADEPEYQWANEGDEWFCPACVAAKVCEAAGGHDWGEWDVYGGNAFRACRRGHCERSERRPVEDVAREEGRADD